MALRSQQARCGHSHLNKDDLILPCELQVCETTGSGESVAELLAQEPGGRHATGDSGGGS